MYQDLKKSSLLSKIVADNVTLFIKGLNYLKDWVIFRKNQYIIDLSELLQRLRFVMLERNLQDNFLEK